MQVWLAFTMRSLVDPELRGLRETAHEGLRGLCRTAAELVGAPDDGLALHAVADPARTTPARIARLLDAELDELQRRH
jgi:hypothetical protein